MKFGNCKINRKVEKNLGDCVRVLVRLIMFVMLGGLVSETVAMERSIERRKKTSKSESPLLCHNCEQPIIKKWPQSIRLGTVEQKSHDSCIGCLSKIINDSCTQAPCTGCVTLLDQDFILKWKVVNTAYFNQEKSNRNSAIKAIINNGARVFSDLVRDIQQLEDEKKLLKERILQLESDDKELSEKSQKVYDD